MKTTTNEQAAQALKRRRDAIVSLRDSNERQRADDTLRKVSDASVASVLDSLSRAEQLEIVEIDAALDRITRGEYGRCETCGGAVGGQRLAALPETRHCVECAGRAEEQPAPSP